MKSGPSSAIQNYTDTNNQRDSSNIMYPGSPCSVRWSSENGAQGGYVSGIGVPFVDGKNRAILSKQNTFISEGWVDAIPDDTAFYLGCSFETHQESPELVSGSNLTNATPLHLQLEYSSPSDGGQFYEPRHNSDQFVSFVNIDAVLRLQPDGTLVSSV